MRLQLDFVRSQFPALEGGWTFFDNAGGSQTLKLVVDRIGEYLLTSDVQLGASYSVSQLAGDRVAQAAAGVATLMNAADPAEVVMGASTSLLLRILACCLGQTFVPGDEVIVTNCDHEANIAPWIDLQRQGVVVKVWRLNADSLDLDLADLEALLSDRTRLVALTHCSNILGTIHDVRAVCDRVHAQGGLVCVDGVGYAAHRLIDVQAIDADFYAFSFYKVYGPHYAALYGRREILAGLPNFNHYFIQELPYKFQPGNVNFELSYGMLGLCDYLSEMARQHGSSTIDLRSHMQQAFALIAEYEEALSDQFLAFLRSKPKVHLVGSAASSRDRRVPTFSFVADGIDSASIPIQVDPHRIAIRYGDFYAKRLIEDLGLAAQSGVVRVSMVHYNTIAEVDRLIEVLDRLL